MRDSTFEMYFSFESSWLDPFNLFHASHFAFPFISKNPGLSVDKKI